MKVVCTDHIDVSVPAETIFSYVADVSKWPVWFVPVVSAQHPQALPVALDEELLLCLQAGRRRWHERFDVTRFVRNAFLSLEGSYSAARRIDFRFEQRGGHTRVGCAIAYPVFGGTIPALVDFVLRRRRVGRELHDSLGRLKGLLEERVEFNAVGDDMIHDGFTPGTSEPERTPTTRMEEPAGAA